MERKRLSPALLPAVFGVLQPPLHMFLFTVLHLAQGERSEELVGGFLTGMLAWALCAGAAFLLAGRSPGAPGNHAARVLSTLGLILFGTLLAFFAFAALFSLKTGRAVGAGHLFAEGNDVLCGSSLRCCLPYSRR